MMNSIDVYDLGSAPYRAVWDLQKRAQQSLIKQKRGENSDHKVLNDILFFVEHPHVYTLGKSGDSTHLLKGLSELSSINAEYIEIDRGGDITYHGPGQIVGYPILDLDRHFTDIHKYLRFLEEVMIRTCADFGVSAGRIKGLTGVWVGQEKICAMGIHCSRWVTMHGFALNVNTDLSYFQHIIPCGIKDREVTSLSKCVGHPVDETEVKDIIIKHFADVFNVKMNKPDSVPDTYSQFSYL
ncbi:lipoyl(octanoyl) transferase LipB [Rhodohalobacter sp. 614A]|uniref:lipoyl(octanoyl) transferase LipB n=1 Tax=Rhodohalobacter sp. 614A TaxID=2908649 RepID=UPI001F1E70B4|nr:lipoyl(octanoyl) transferase LipB [Rhodohalobacter sp. 614A]